MCQFKGCLGRATCKVHLISASDQLNPKTPGLFGPSDTRGGAAAAHFRERRLELPNFHFCPQTVFHMKAGIFS